LLLKSWSATALWAGLLILLRGGAPATEKVMATVLCSVLPERQRSVGAYTVTGEPSARNADVGGRRRTDANSFP
jgi:hypothetical protein